MHSLRPTIALVEPDSPVSVPPDHAVKCQCKSPKAACAKNIRRTAFRFILCSSNITPYITRRYLELLRSCLHYQIYRLLWAGSLGLWTRNWMKTYWPVRSVPVDQPCFFDRYNQNYHLEQRSCQFLHLEQVLGSKRSASKLSYQMEDK